MVLLITDPVLAHRQMCAPHATPKNISLKYICPMLKGAKNQDKGYRGYGYDDPPEQVPQVSSRVRSVQVTPIVGLPTHVINQTSHVDKQCMFEDEFP